MGATNQQIKQFWSMLRQVPGADKESLVLQFSGGRTSSLKEINRTEMEGLLQSLRSQIHTGGTADRMRKKIISCCYTMGMTIGGAIDMDQVNRMVASKGYLKDEGKTKLNDYNAKELPTLVTQFERMKQYYLKKNAVR